MSIAGAGGDERHGRLCVDRTPESMLICRRNRTRTKDTLGSGSRDRHLCTSSTAIRHRRRMGTMDKSMKSVTSQKIPAKKSPDDVVAEYARLRPLQEEFTRRLTDLLHTLIADRSIEVHGIESRTKTIESLREKMTRGTKGYSQALDQVTDLTGIRVIVYYNDDVDAISRLVEKEFDVDGANSMDKRQTLKPQEFGYQSVHYVVRISASRGRLPEWKRFTALRAEIQVRTVLQHAWAAISHKLAYKREADIPSELRRKLFRLSALLELGDDEFASLRDQTQALSKDIRRQIEQGEPDIELDLVSLREYLTTASEVATLVANAKQVGFAVRHADEEIYSDLLRLLHSVGVTTVGGLEDVLRRSEPWAKKYFQSLLIEARTPNAIGKWEGSSPFFVSLVVIGFFKHIVSVKQLVDSGSWHNDIAERVMKVATKIDTGTSAS